MVSLQVRKEQTRELATKASCVEKQAAWSEAQRDPGVGLLCVAM